MSKFKSTPLKLGLCILSAVLLTVCLSAGIVWAAISITKTYTPSVPVAELSSEIWTASSGGTALTSFTTSNTASKTLYVSATSGGTAIKVPCVMRAYIVGANKANLSVGSGWTAQDNGWYYCNTIVGGTGNTGRIILGTVNSSGFSGNIMIDLMQFTSRNNEGFVKYWSPLAGRTSSTISGSATIEGLAFTSTATDGKGVFAAFNKAGSGRTQYTSLADATTVSATTSLIAPIPAGTYAQNATASSTISSLSSGNLVIYNNSVVPMVFTISYAFVAYEKNGSNYTKAGSQDFTISTYTAGSGWTSTSETNLYIYSAVVQPGEYINALSGSVTVKYTGESAKTVTEGEYAVRVAATITAEDVEMMYTKTNSTDAKYASYDKYAGKCPASKYLTWINAVNNNGQGFTINFDPLATS